MQEKLENEYFLKEFYENGRTSIPDSCKNIEMHHWNNGGTNQVWKIAGKKILHLK